jgi:hypothetical protein
MDPLLIEEERCLSFWPALTQVFVSHRASLGVVLREQKTGVYLRDVSCHSFAVQFGEQSAHFGAQGVLFESKLIEDGRRNNIDLIDLDLNSTFDQNISTPDYDSYMVMNSVCSICRYQRW